MDLKYVFFSSCHASKYWTSIVDIESHDDVIIADTFSGLFVNMYNIVWGSFQKLKKICDHITFCVFAKKC